MKEGHRSVSMNSYMFQIPFLLYCDGPRKSPSVELLFLFFFSNQTSVTLSGLIIRPNEVNGKTPLDLNRTGILWSFHLIMHLI